MSGPHSPHLTATGGNAHAEAIYSFLKPTERAGTHLSPDPRVLHLGKIVFNDAYSILWAGSSLLNYTLNRNTRFNQNLNTFCRYLVLSQGEKALLGNSRTLF